MRAHSSAFHSIEHKLNAFQEAFDNGSATQKDLDDLEKSWKYEMDKLKMKKRLKSTRISSLDNLFDYFEGQFLKDDIVFTLMLDGDVKYLVNNVIKQPHFETLITNHLTDAKIAVNASSNTYRRVSAFIGFDEYYEFTIHDSGIPFEVDTLVRLGEERVTTHADTGGSGIGFEATFEILREYNASLKISEYEESNTSFSKTVTILFDGKGQYIIETYRPDEFPANERYIVESRISSQSFSFLTPRIQ